MLVFVEVQSKQETDVAVRCCCCLLAAGLPGDRSVRLVSQEADGAHADERPKVPLVLPCEFLQTSENDFIFNVYLCHPSCPHPP